MSVQSAGSLIRLDASPSCSLSVNDSTGIEEVTLAMGETIESYCSSLNETCRNTKDDILTDMNMMCTLDNHFSSGFLVHTTNGEMVNALNGNTHFLSNETLEAKIVLSCDLYPKTCTMILESVVQQ